jgi:hypothetical protein
MDDQRSIVLRGAVIATAVKQPGMLQVLVG